MMRRTLISLAVAGALSLAANGAALAQNVNPCAAKNPCAARPPAGAIFASASKPLYDPLSRDHVEAP
jgi:hypothetical protein